MSKIINIDNRKAAEKEHDRLDKFYREYPKEFERQMKEKLKKAINNAAPCNQDMLIQLQRTIDARLKRHQDPISRCQVVARMLFDKVKELNALQHILYERGSGAKILTFPQKK